jgi:hypothetical protein
MDLSFSGRGAGPHGYPLPLRGHCPPRKSSPKDGDDANQLVVVARLRSLALKLIFWRLVRKRMGILANCEDRRAALSGRAGCRAVCERTAACRHHARWPNRVCRASAARRYPHEAAAGAYRGRAGWSHHLRGRRAAQDTRTQRQRCLDEEVAAEGGSPSQLAMGAIDPKMASVEK